MNHEPTMSGLKQCKSCERVLPVICFAVQKGSKDGLRGQCRECVVEQTRAKKGQMPGRQGKGKKQISWMKTYHNFHSQE